VRHEIEGYIVPKRDPAALATAIEQVVENRQSRATLSLAGLSQLDPVFRILARQTGGFPGESNDFVSKTPCSADLPSSPPQRSW
jgi:hypothetical protein